MDTIVLILWTVFCLVCGGFVMWLILSEKHNKKWEKEYKEFQKSRILCLEESVASKELLLGYLDSMELFWCGYKRMYDTYKIIRDDFEFFERYPVTGKAVLNGIPKLVECRLKELEKTDETFARILELDMDNIDVWKPDTHIDDLVPHGKAYLNIEKHVEENNEYIEKMKKLINEK